MDNFYLFERLLIEAIWVIQSFFLSCNLTPEPTFHIKIGFLDVFPKN